MSYLPVLLALAIVSVFAIAICLVDAWSEQNGARGRLDDEQWVRMTLQESKRLKALQYVAYLNRRQG